MRNKFNQARKITQDIAILKKMFNIVLISIISGGGVFYSSLVVVISTNFNRPVVVIVE
jgi:hypothetical protein